MIYLRYPLLMYFQAIVLERLGEVPKEPSTLYLDEQNIPSGKVLVKVLFSSICQSQIQEILGGRDNQRFIPHMLGHEGIGVVEAVGELVTRFRKGDVVIMTWMKTTGLESGGGNQIYNAHTGSPINYGPVTSLAQYSLVSENRLVKIEDGLNKKAAPLLGCAIPTGAGAVKNLVKNPNQKSILIAGLGGVGTSAVIESVRLGFANVVVSDMSLEKQKWLKQHLPKVNFVCAGQEGYKDQLMVLNKFEKFDYVYDCTGSTLSIENNFEVIKETGMLFFASHPPVGLKISLDPFDLIKGKKIQGVWGSAGNHEKDIEFYARQLQTQGSPWNHIHGETYKLESFFEVIQKMIHSNETRPIIDMG